MNFIFNHENLRLDEIMKKISSRNNFSPQKPLKNYVNLRTVKTTKKKLNLRNNKSIHNSPKFSKDECFFPFLPKFSSNSSPKNYKSISSELEIVEYLESQRHGKEIIMNYFNLRDSAKEDKLPDILRKNHISLDCKRSENVNRKKKLITHIPSVNLISEAMREKNPLSQSLEYDL